MPPLSPHAPRRRRRLLAGLSTAALALAGAATASGAAGAAVPARAVARHASARLQGVRERGGAPARAAAVAMRPSAHAERVARAALVAARAAAVQRAAGTAATSSWCATHGSSVGAWTGTVPDLPICGPGPAYGGTWAWVDLPGPGGVLGGYYNATPGFQCVELAERWLAVGEDLAPVKANGDTLAAAYHAAYPHSLLIANGSAAAVGHAPQVGDVISFSFSPVFEDPTDGHVAVVAGARIDAAGDGTVEIAQQNVSSTDYRMVLDLVHWRLVDPAEPPNAALQYPYAEWFHLLPTRAQLLAAARTTPAGAQAVTARASAAIAHLLRAAVVRVHGASTGALRLLRSPRGGVR